MPSVGVVFLFVVGYAFACQWFLGESDPVIVRQKTGCYGSFSC
jgi:hypothetical protein